MRERWLGAALAACLALLAGGPLAAQQQPPPFQRDPHLNPDDQFAPSQIAQPMPAPAPGPSAAPAHTPAKPPKRTTAKPATAKPVHAVPAKPAPPGHYKTVVACSGPFAKDSGMLALAVAFDSRNMIFTEETVQGVKVGATVLFPKDPRRRLEVWWSSPNRTGTYLIDIAGKSIWTGPEGLRLGLTLQQLEKLNHKPFKLKGFGADNLATVSDWNGGALASLPGGCKAGVTVHTAKADAATALPAADQYSSDDPAMRALKPTVSEILIGY